MADPRENGQRNSPQSYGHTIILNRGQQNSPPFKLLFGEEAILPKELTHKSPRVTFAKDAATTQDEEQLTKDLAEELRCQAVNNLRSYQVETA